jgi:hypothetical protein
MTGFRVLMTCQHENCKKEFRDLDSYYAHLENHESEKESEKKN